MRHEQKCHFDHMMPLEGAAPVEKTAASTGQIGEDGLEVNSIRLLDEEERCEKRRQKAAHADRWSCRKQTGAKQLLV